MVSQANISNYSGESEFLLRKFKPIPFVYRKPHDLTMRKYEIYLPLKYNDGAKIEPLKFKEIRQQLIAVFGAVTTSPRAAPFEGTWRYAGVEFVDDIIRIEIITD